MHFVQRGSVAYVTFLDLLLRNTKSSLDITALPLCFVTKQSQFDKELNLYISSCQDSQGHQEVPR